MSLISGEQLLRVQLGAWVSCCDIPINLTTCVSRFKCCILLFLLTANDPGCQRNVDSLSGTLSRLRVILQVVPIVMHPFPHPCFHCRSLISSTSECKRRNCGLTPSVGSHTQLCPWPPSSAPNTNSPCSSGERRPRTMVSQRA